MIRTIGECMPAALNEINRQYHGKSGLPGYKTGFTEFDTVTGGIKSEYTIIAARPSVGLSSFVRQLGLSLAKQGLKGAIFDLECTPETIAHRVLSLESGISDIKLRSGLLRIEELGLLMSAAGKIVDAPLLLQDRKLFTPNEILDRLKRLVKEQDCKWIIVDHLFSTTPVLDTATTAERLDTTSKSLREVQSELGVPMIITMQLPVEGAEDMVSLSFLQAADTVLLLKRSGEIPDKKTPDAFDIQLIIAQQRSGPLVNIDLKFFPATSTFKENASIPDEAVMEQK